MGVNPSPRSNVEGVGLVVVGGAPSPQHQVALILLHVGDLAGLLQHLLALDIEADDLTALVLGHARFLHGLEECMILDDNIMVPEECSHEGGIDTLGLELCLGLQHIYNL